MSTTFAITGYRRHSLKHYRPSYYSDLAPIYEDVPVQALPAKSARKFSLLSEYSQEIKVYCSKNDSYHNYAEVDVKSMNGKVANPSPMSASMMDGLMKSRFQKKSSKKEINENFPDIGQNFTKRNPDENMNRYVKKSEANDVNVELGLKEDPKDRHENGTITLERTSSLYQSPFTANSSLDYAVVTNDRGMEVKRWPKLEPEPPRDRTLCCPAEQKMKKRCFAVCFLVLVGLIVLFVVAMIDGWLIKETGKGLSGTDQLTMFANTPIMFSNDIGTEDNVTETLDTSSTANWADLNSTASP